MGNLEWHERFPNATLHNLIVPISDHNPILLDTEPPNIRPRKRTFKFENRWLFEKELKGVVGRSWQGFSDLDFMNRIKALGETLALWGNRADSEFRIHKKELERKIQHLQDTNFQHGTTEYIKTREELGKLIVQEEAFWRQRAKVFCLRDGDMNTKFFHQSATAKKRRNKIVKLQNDEGEWEESQQGMCNIINSYFTQLFTADLVQDNGDDLLEAVQSSITTMQNDDLTKEFTEEEFKRAIKQMHPEKAPGPDGFNPAFYQKCWESVVL